MTRQRREPKAITEALHVKPGHDNTGQPEAAVVKPASDGHFSLRLVPGEYCVVRESKEKMPTAGDQYNDGACLRRWQQSCDAVWKVEAKDVDGTFNINNSCFGPCYRGPMPP
jgi:hypothetical protein